MRPSPLRWLAGNVGTLVLAFILALVVWVSAVITADPNQKQTFRPVPIEVYGQDPGLLQVNDIPNQARLTLMAPKSIWDQLNNNPALAKSWVDLAGLGPGEHTVPVKTQVSASPVRFVQVEPREIRVNLEPLVKREFLVQLTVSGELPLGYKEGNLTMNPGKVTISGPASSVAKVAKAHASLDISGATETIKRVVPIEVMDQNGEPVANLSVEPKTIEITQPVSLLGGFKNVVVKVATTGQVANGYRLTNIQVSPPTVTLFSDNPQLIDGIPGFVDTIPVDLNNLSEDTEISVGLNLPEGVTTVKEPKVLVQIGVASIEGSLTLSVPVEVINLAPDLRAVISPKTVDIIVAGPLNVLDKLTPSSFRVVLDVGGLPPGVYQRPPTVDFAPENVRVQTTLPETVEVSIELPPSPTPTAIVPATNRSTPTPATTPTPRKTPAAF